VLKNHNQESSTFLNITHPRLPAWIKACRLNIRKNDSAILKYKEIVVPPCHVLCNRYAIVRARVINRVYVILHDQGYYRDREALYDRIWKDDDYETPKDIEKEREYAGSESSGYAITENQRSEMRLLSDEKGRKHTHTHTHTHVCTHTLREKEREKERDRKKGEKKRKDTALRRYEESNLTTNQ